MTAKRKVKKVKREHPLEKRTPYVWVVEPTRGCNLRCGHCCRRLDKDHNYQYMTKEVWDNTFSVINQVSPTCRIDLCLTGEPTLNPNLPELLRSARKLAPLTQIQITTNGITLLNKKVDYLELLSSGANIIYTDMYGPEEEFIELAKASGFEWSIYYDKAPLDISPWTYYGPHIKMIVLQQQPENWPKSRKRAGLLGTWLNNLDWQAAEAFNLHPVEEAPKRRCNQPFQYVAVNYTGDYLLCCQDGMSETAGLFGNTSTGKEGFLSFWLGKEMQTIRRHLRNKDRSRVNGCNRCDITFSRCDYKNWTPELLSQYWDGSNWVEMEDDYELPLQD